MTRKTLHLRPVPQPGGFGAFSESIIKGGTLTDADVNEWPQPRSVWRQTLDYFLTGRRDG